MPCGSAIEPQDRTDIVKRGIHWFPHVQLRPLSFHVLAAGWAGDTWGLDGLQPETQENLTLESSDADTDGLDAAPPYSGTSYEDEDADAEGLGVELPASHQDSAADLIPQGGDVGDSSLEDAQQEEEETASGSISNKPGMGEVDSLQAEAPAAAETAEGPSRSNGATIKRTPSSITFRF